MKMAVVLDPLASLNPKKDSSLAMIKQALDLGWSCFAIEQQDIYCQAGQAFAALRSLHYHDQEGLVWAPGELTAAVPMAELDIILMRKDPPFDLEYIYTTYALELAEKAGVLVANRPQSLRDANEKFFALQFANCCPETLVSRDMKGLKAFWEQQQDVVFKPLAGMGGKAVFHVGPSGENLSVILEQLTEGGKTSIMAQRYIPEIKISGDKRIILVHGQAIPFALARIPAAGEFRGNLAAGGSGKLVPLSKRDFWIAEQLGPSLLAKGLYFVGIDVIGDYLTEINVTSPTCLKEIEAGSGLKIALPFLLGLERLRNSGKNNKV